VLILPDHVNGFGGRADKAAYRSARSEPVAFRRYCGVIKGEKPRLNTGLFDRLVIACHRVAMPAEYRQLTAYFAVDPTSGRRL
jgi:hypothetical protein